MLSHMCPSIAQLADGASLAIGCPGARRIPTIIGLVLARHLFGGIPLQEAVARGRFHAETQLRATLEQARWSSEVLNALRSGFEVVEDEDPSLYYGPLTPIMVSL